MKLAGATMNENLFALIRERMPEPGKTFIRTQSGRTVTYGDVVAVSGRMAKALVRLGVRPGDRVAAQVPKSPEALLLYLDCIVLRLMRELGKTVEDMERIHSNLPG